MAALTLQDAEALRDAALSALTSALKAKETMVTGSVGGRKHVNHDIDKLQAAFDRADALCQRLSRIQRGPTFVRVVPCG